MAGYNLIFLSSYGGLIFKSLLSPGWLKFYFFFVRQLHFGLSLRVKIGFLFSSDIQPRSEGLKIKFKKLKFKL
jgi:hypothetical protein